MTKYTVHLIYGTSFSVRADTVAITERFIHFYIYKDDRPESVECIVSISRSIVFDIPEEM